MDKGKDYAGKPLTAEEEAELQTLFPKYKSGDYLRFGELGFIFSSRFDLARMKNFKVYEDDTWLVTPPKCGTTWMQEISWLAKSQVDTAGADRNQFYRYPFLEFEYILGPTDKPYPTEGTPHDEEHVREFMHHSFAFAEKMPRPRMIKTHLPLSILPDNLLETSKVIYVARNIKDAAVSYYHHNCLLMKGKDSTLKDAGFNAYARLYKKGVTRNSPFFDTMIEAWNKRNEKNMHFVTYEDLHKDFDAELDRLLKFLGVTLSDEKRKILKERTTLDSFRQNKFVNKEKEMPHDPSNKDERFMRKGVVGDWRNHFDEENNQDWDPWIKQKLEGTAWDMVFEQ